MKVFCTLLNADCVGFGLNDDHMKKAHSDQSLQKLIMLSLNDDLNSFHERVLMPKFTYKKDSVMSYSTWQDGFQSSEIKISYFYQKLTPDQIEDYRTDPICPKVLIDGQFVVPEYHKFNCCRSL